MENITKPELLAPAGDMEKLRVALAYGADAVYLAAQRFSLRANAKNFDEAALAEAVAYTHALGKKLYVTVNIYAHNEDLEGLPAYFKTLAEIGADAAIVSDPGVFMLARQAAPGLDLHISTQANTTNAQSVLFWQSLGAARIVLARELSLNEIAAIRARITPPESTSPKEGIELEAFVHGAMCMSYSGRCLLSSYLTGRDANRGDCAQACRWGYAVSEATRPGDYMPIEEDARGTYIFNARDLCMIEHIPALLSASIDSLKIEGRMKTPYYVGVVVKAYRQALDDFFTSPALYESKKSHYLTELEKASHRPFGAGFFFGKPGADEQVYGNSSYVRTYDFIGMVKEYDPSTQMALVEQRNRFVMGEEVELLQSRGQGFTQVLSQIYDLEGRLIQAAPHAQQLVRIPVAQPVAPLDMLRRAVLS